MEVKKYFHENRFSRMSDIIGEGKQFLDNRMMGNLRPHDIQSCDLVDKKPSVNRVVVGRDNPRLAIMCEQIKNGLGDADNESGPKMGELYQAVRTGGSLFRSAESVVNVGGILLNTGEAMVCRRGEYYESMLHLGAHFFSANIAKLQSFDSLLYKVRYAMFSGLGQDECRGLGSSEYAIEAKIEVLREGGKKHGRRLATWADGTYAPKRYLNSKCYDIMNETSVKVEDLLTAMLLPRDNISLTSQELVKLREYLHMGPSSCLTTRFLVLYLIVLRMWHSRVDKIKITIDKKNITTKEFTTGGLSECISIRKDDTVVNVINMNKVEQMIMARSVFGYRSGDFLIENYDFYLGGFDIPPEVSENGRVTLLGGTEQDSESVDVTQEEVYNTMVKYAMRMQACGEMEMGFNLASNLIFADGLPNFSIPRPQGYLDVIATALSKVNTNGFVPPYKVNELAVLGAMVLSRQQILLAHDLIMHSETTEAEDIVPLTRVPAETRQALYTKYKNERFSDAFGLSAIVDPLLLLSEKQVCKVRNIPFPTLAWSSINNDRLVKNTLSEYFWRGEWAEQRYWTSLDATTQKKAKSTYYANGFFQSPTASGIKVKKWIGVESMSSGIALQPGKVSTHLLDVECTMRCAPRKGKAFKTKEVILQEYEDDDTTIVIDVETEETPQMYPVFTAENQLLVYENEFGGKVVPHILDKGKGKNKNKVNPIVLVIQSGEKAGQPKAKNVPATDKEDDSDKLVAEVQDLINSSKTKKANSFDNRLRLPPKKSQLLTSNLSRMVTAFGEYINKRHCKADSVMSRVQHCLSRLAPEAVGTVCALRNELHLSGLSKTSIRMWQLAVTILMPYLPQLEDKGQISVLQLNKMLCYCSIVRSRGTARTRFNLVSLPAFDPNKALYKSWIYFLDQVGLVVTFNNQELEEVEAFNNKEFAGFDDVTDELMELTIGLRFPSTTKLCTAWDYTLPQKNEFPAMTNDEMNEIEKVLKSACVLCSY